MAGREGSSGASVIWTRYPDREQGVVGEWGAAVGRAGKHVGAGLVEVAGLVDA